jgi:fucose 4-O-acetylase-like acetyltransferase
MFRLHHTNLQDRSMRMADDAGSSDVGNERTRFYWLDNLRTFMIFLVVLGHATVVYEKYSMGADWWIVIDPAPNDVPGILFLILNIFVIATIFLVSGFLTPLSLKNKTGWDFIKSKFRRLIIPWCVAVLTMIPLYKVIFLYSRNMPQESWTSYFHWSAMWSQNWLWFLPVLFLFDILFLALSKVPMNPSFFTLKRGIWAGFLICLAYGFCMDFYGLHGWTKSVLLDFQNERILIYFMVYLLGALCYAVGIFEREWKNKKLDILLHSTGWIPMNAYIFLVIYALVKPGDYLISRAGDTLLVRLIFLLALAYLLYAMTTSFKKYLNKQGKLSRELNENSYYVYIIHVVIMGGIATALLNTGIHSLVKFFGATIATYLISNLLVSSYRRVVARVL